MSAHLDTMADGHYKQLIRRGLKKWGPITQDWTRRDLLVHIVECEEQIRRHELYLHLLTADIKRRA